MRQLGHAAIAGGIALRLAQLLDGRPLWLDEAWLTLNILSRPLHGFFRPLDDRQISPIGFLWVEWTITRIGGPGELALRLVPFVAGVLTLIAFAHLARRLLDPGAALVATTLAALSPLLIRYSAEVKSYGCDALTAILLMHATLDLVEQGAARQAYVRWALAAALASLLSTAAPFTVGGSVLVLVALTRLRDDAGALRHLAVGCVPAALLVILQLVILSRLPETTAYMQGYWSGAFVELHLVRGLTGLGRAIRGLWAAMLFGGEAQVNLRGTMTLLVALSMVGIVSLARRDRPGVALLLAPIALAAGAALWQYWPLTPRLLLFAAPAVFLTIAAGIAALARLAPARARGVVLGAVAMIVIAGTLRGAAAQLRDPLNFDSVPEALAHVGTRHGGDATVYVAAYYVPACAYYSAWRSGRPAAAAESTSQDCAIPGARTVIGRWPPEDTPRSEAVRLLGAATADLWLILPPGESELPSEMERAGRVRVSERKWPRIAVYQYRRRLPD